MDLYKTIEHKGYQINIYYDENPPDPRNDWDNLGTLYTMHRHYQPEKNFDKHFDIEEVFTGDPGNFSEVFLQKYIALPVYLYDHSGLTVSTTPFSCRWDSDLFGIIAVDKEKVKKEFDWKIINERRRKKIEGYLKSEIEELDDYYTGSVYGYETIEDESGESLDSCWGYFGDDGLKQIESECKSFIDRHIWQELMSKVKKGIQLRIPFLEFPEFAIENVNHLQLTKI